MPSVVALRPALRYLARTSVMSMSTASEVTPPEDIAHNLQGVRERISQTAKYPEKVRRRRRKMHNEQRRGDKQQQQQQQEQEQEENGSRRAAVEMEVVLAQWSGLRVELS